MSVSKAVTHLSRALILGLVLAGPGHATAAPPADPLTQAMSELRKGDWAAARDAAVHAGPVARDIVDWHRLRAGKGSFDEVRDFLTRNPDWPGLRFLRRRSEGVVPYRARAEEVIGHFAEEPPQTGAGMIVLAAAHEKLGQDDTARALLIRAWTEFNLSTGDESYMLERYGKLLKPHHVARLDRLLWDGDAKAAERMLPRVSKDWQALARARIALRAQKNGVDGLIAAVPKALNDHPGLAFERFNWRARKGRNASAIELITERGPDGLGRPGDWSNWRRLLARWSMRQGDGKTAYQLASTHGLSEGSNFADLEWLSGYLALRYLDDAERALAHFRRFRAAVKTPISLGRAGYWEGRAHEALGNAEAAAQAYGFGAMFQTSFYGLLAAERAGASMDPALTGTAEYGDWADTPFASSSVLEAALMLHRAGEEALAERFLVHLAESLDADELGSLATFALDTLEEPHIALMVAKQAARQGVVLPRAYFPVIDLGLAELPVPAELALAIARRESEFDPHVRSPAGALGLMQVMPATGREVARMINVRFSKLKLRNDPVYNARLGVTYLAELREIFGPNHLLVAAAYNAGPGRPIRWIDAYGDPRDPDVDPVDWIEHIPFRETRNYVMRVTESLPVYRARLTGETAPIRLSKELRAE